MKAVEVGGSLARPVMSTLRDVTHHVGVREAGEAAVDGNGAKGAFFFPVAVGGAFGVREALSYQLCGHQLANARWG